VEDKVPSKLDIQKTLIKELKSGAKLEINIRLKTTKPGQVLESLDDIEASFEKLMSNFIYK
jgi:hypothetical protein